MKLTQSAEMHRNVLAAHIDSEGNGFILGAEAQIIPQSFSDKYNEDKLHARQVGDFRRVIDRSSTADAINMKPIYCRVTKADTLIIE